jgi:hypothetical protein
MNWIAVSDIAILTGNNKYQTSTDSIQKYRNKLNKPTNQTPIATTATAASIIESCISESLLTDLNISNSNAIVEQIINTPQFIHDVAETSTVAEIRATVQSHVYKSHGKKYEDHVYDWLKNESDLDGEFSDLQKGQGRDIGFLNGIRWRIYGKVDGLFTCSRGVRYILEIKNRQNRLFNATPIYEKIQIQSYMHIFKIKMAILVQHFNNTYQIDYFEYDKKFIVDVLGELLDVIKNNIQ